MEKIYIIKLNEIKKGKDHDAGKDWRQEEKWMTENEMVGWHHQLDGHDFGQVLGVGGGQQSLACCSPWDCKESDTIEWLNWLTVRQLILQFQIKNIDSSEKCPHNGFLGYMPQISLLTPDRGFPHGPGDRESACNKRDCLHAGDSGSIPGQEDPLER